MVMHPPNTQQRTDMPLGTPHVSHNLVSPGAPLPPKHSMWIQLCTNKLAPRTKKDMRTNRRDPGGLPLPLHHKAKRNECNSNSRRNMKDRCTVKRSTLVKAAVEVLSIIPPVARHSIAMALRGIAIVRRV